MYGVVCGGVSEVSAMHVCDVYCDVNRWQAALAAAKKASSAVCSALGGSGAPKKKATAAAAALHVRVATALDGLRVQELQADAVGTDFSKALTDAISQVSRHVCVSTCIDRCLDMYVYRHA